MYLQNPNSKIRIYNSNNKMEKDIIIAIISAIAGFFGGMTYSNNQVKVKQKAGKNSTQNASGRDTNQTFLNK
jgi:hypothetical protein